MSEIKQLKAREILDSRGFPTVEVEVLTSKGVLARAAVPSGASTGAHEACELRDEDSSRFLGKGVQKAVHFVQKEIQNNIKGMDVSRWDSIDEALLKLDGTKNKSRLGANAVLGVSLACAKAAAKEKNKNLFAYIGGKDANTLPIPMMNILNGGSHADNSIDFQEFMVMPIGVSTFADALRVGSEIFQTLRTRLKQRGLATSVGDEGGFAPNLQSNREAIDLVLEAIVEAGFTAGQDVYLALDIAASELWDKASPGRYTLKKSDGSTKTAEDLVQMYCDWVAEYPIASIEDGLAEHDWEGWKQLTAALGSRVQLVGDDNFVTNTKLLARGIREKVANGILIKLNQIGTVTETLEAVSLAKKAGWGTIISHRSGETEDTTVADLAVATAAGQIKAGAPARGERTAKYNRLLRIEEELSGEAHYAGLGVYGAFLARPSAGE